MPSRDECDGFRHERGVVGTSCTFWKSDAASPIRAGPDAWSSRVLFNWLAPHGYIMALLDGSEQPAPHSAATSSSNNNIIPRGTRPYS